MSRKAKRVEHAECEESYQTVSVSALLDGIHSSTHDRLEGKIDDIHKIVTEQSELLAQIGQLSEQLLRESMRSWNFQTSSLFNELPSLFVLMPSDRKSFDARKWFNEAVHLYLLCQHPAQPHIVENEKEYVIQLDHEWWRQVAPWVRRLSKVLKYVPNLGPVAKAYDEVWYESIERQAEVFSAASKALPTLAERTHQLEKHYNELPFGAIVEPEAAALRALHTFLREQKSQHLCGLQRVVTNDGNVLWLCSEHAKFHSV